MTKTKQEMAIAKSKDKLSKANAAFVRERLEVWRKDWNVFAREVLGVDLDVEQQKIITAIQREKMISVCSGTARGKDFLTAVAVVCFFVLTPRFSTGVNGEAVLTESTKVFLLGNNIRQVQNVMLANLRSMFARAAGRGIPLPGRVSGSGVNTPYGEWFIRALAGTKNNIEAWTGLHAEHVFFAVTEASGIADEIFTAIEGNLQGDSRFLLVFNPNRTSGYAAMTMGKPLWTRFRLSSLTAPSVLGTTRRPHPGQVSREWVEMMLGEHARALPDGETEKETENDFCFEGRVYRPDDLFRIKVLGCFPKVSEDVLIPQYWVELAEERYRRYFYDNKGKMPDCLHTIYGVDVAGMGRDSSVIVARLGNLVYDVKMSNSGGRAAHMALAGELVKRLNTIPTGAVSIDTIGEGAGVYSRMLEVSEVSAVRWGSANVVSCKFGSGATTGRLHPKPLKDEMTGLYEFVKMKDYLYWRVREWLMPDRTDGTAAAMLVPGTELGLEGSHVLWGRDSMGRIKIEPKETTKGRLGKSPDVLDALANTFHPDAIRCVTMGSRTGIMLDGLL